MERLDLNTVIAVCSAFIALTAVAVAVISGVLTRKHNRLSVKPRLVITRLSYSDNCKISVANKGIGPAVIRKFDIYLDNEMVQKENEVSTISAAVKQALPFTGTIQTLLVHEDEAIAEKEELDLLSIYDPPQDIPSLRTIMEGLQKIRFLIEYESLYEETFRLDECDQLPAKYHKKCKQFLIFNRFKAER